MENLRVLPLHKHSNYIDDCVKLLNSEWPRSRTARLKSIQPSCDSLPTCLVMVYTLSNDASDDTNCNNQDCCTTDSDCKELNECDSLQLNTWSNQRDIVVGHSKVSRLSCVPDGCLIESVVMHKSYRGKGWGKFLMEKTEQYIKQLGGINFIYLTTVDMQRFYNKIGYSKTEPVPLFGGPPSFNSSGINSAFKRLIISSASLLPRSGRRKKNSIAMQPPTIGTNDFTCSISSPADNNRIDNSDRNDTDRSRVLIERSNSIESPPSVIPPPPPLPLFGIYNNKRPAKRKSLNDSKKTFMIKMI